MSLYESASVGVHFKFNSIVKGRPKWLEIVLAIATGYTLIFFLFSVTNIVLDHIQHEKDVIKLREINEPLRRYPDAFSLLNANTEKFIENIQEIQNKRIVANVIHLIIAIVSTMYFFKGLKILGLAVAGLWSISFLIVITKISEIDVGYLGYMYFVIDYGWDKWSRIASVLIQTLFFMTIYYYSAMKFSLRNDKTESYVRGNWVL